MKYLLLLAPFILLIALTGCGKKATEVVAPNVHKPDPNPIEPDPVDDMLEKQELICDQDKCPSYLTKIVIRNRDHTLKFCTGTLTDEKTIATSTSCLPDYLRAVGLSCEKDIHFFFEGKERPIRVKCKEIKKVSAIDNREPVYWRSNLAFLEIDGKIDREALGRKNINRQGLKDMADTVVWSINAETDFMGRIRRSECHSVHSTFFNPFANNESSPNMTLSGCSYEKGNSGSPVLDLRGNLRGIVSRPVEKAAIDEIVRRGILHGTTLKPITYISNMACAPTIYDENVLDFEECSRELSESIFLDLQDKMISLDDLFRAPLQTIENYFNRNEFINVRLVKVFESHDHIRVKPEPRCFKNVQEWISRFPGRDPHVFKILDVKEKSLRRHMDEHGKIKLLETTSREIDYNFQFTPRLLRNNRYASVLMWRQGENSQPFYNISENCLVK